MAQTVQQQVVEKMSEQKEDWSHLFKVYADAPPPRVEQRSNGRTVTYFKPDGTVAWISDVAVEIADLHEAPVTGNRKTRRKGG